MGIKFDNFSGTRSDVVGVKGRLTSEMGGCNVCPYFTNESDLFQLVGVEVAKYLVQNLEELVKFTNLVEFEN